jgi:hypothetical protein
MFSAEVARKEEHWLFYDVVRGYSREELKSVIIRTCDVYESPLEYRRRIRYPMRPTDSLQQLIRYIQKEILPCQTARLLLDNDGEVRLLSPNETVEEAALLRFEPVPADQVRLKSGEFLVVALICRQAKGGVAAISTGVSFIFKVVPGEVISDTRKRIGLVKFAEEKCLAAISFQTSKRYLNDDERLDTFMSPNDVLKAVLPERTRSSALFRRMKHSGH